MKKLFLLLAIAGYMALQGCSNAKASLPVSELKKPMKVESVKVSTYKVISNGQTYKDVGAIKKDSSGCISFHIPGEGGCVYGGSPEKDVKICGSYLVEEIYQ